MQFYSCQIYLLPIDGVHFILLNHLNRVVGSQGEALPWFASYPQDIIFIT